MSQSAANSTISDKTSAPAASTRTSPVETRDLDASKRRQPSVLAVKVSEVSGQIGLPLLRKSPRLQIPATAALTVTKPLVVQFKISPNGQVVGSQMINESQENTALAPIVKATLSEWEFTSAGTASGGTLVKYFSFRIVPVEDASAAHH